MSSLDPIKLVTLLVPLHLYDPSWSIVRLVSVRLETIVLSLNGSDLEAL